MAKQIKDSQDSRKTKISVNLIALCLINDKTTPKS